MDELFCLEALRQANLLLERAELLTEHSQLILRTGKRNGQVDLIRAILYELSQQTVRYPQDDLGKHLRQTTAEDLRVLRGRERCQLFSDGVADIVWRVAREYGITPHDLERSRDDDNHQAPAAPQPPA